MTIRLNPNRAKIHRSYTVEEVAILFGVHKNTVRNWIKKGLPVLDDQKPCLILGCELKAFLKTSRQKNKKKCKPDEMYCMSCKLPRKAAANMVDYDPFSSTTGRLIGLCSVCGNIINKFASFESLPEFSKVFDITFPVAEKHINKSVKPLLNSDLNSRG